MRGVNQNLANSQAASCRAGSGDFQICSVFGPAETAGRVAEAAGGGDVLFLGSGAVEYADELTAALGGAFTRGEAAVTEPTPAAMAAMVEDGDLPDPGDAATLEPIYLRGI